LQRAEAQILGARGEYEAEIARAKQQVSETEQQLLSLEAERDAENAEARDEKLAALNEISKDLAAGHDILKRTTINSPVAGTVLELRFRTIGGVVQPGDAILDIVPENEDLLIEARISPADVDVVHAGLPAKVQLTAFASRATPKVDGLVRSVSADRITDDRWPEPFFLARVQVDRDALKRAIGAEAQLVPGMPADVLVVTGERTLLGYLLQPLRDNLGRALREG
jgi:HlyD family secretion protein/epimerase transport system membrane fusion protein